MNTPLPEDADRRLERELRALPLRRAPDSLEDRVLSAIEARARLPWWHQSYSRWPVPAQRAFRVFSASIAGVIIALAMQLIPADGAGGFSLLDVTRNWFGWLRSSAGAVHDTVGNLFPEISTIWIRVTFGAIGVLFAALTGSLVLAYRMLWQTR